MMMPDFESLHRKKPVVEELTMDLSVVAELPSGKRMDLSMKVPTSWGPRTMEEIIYEIRLDVSRRCGPEEDYRDGDVLCLVKGRREDCCNFEPFHSMATVDPCLTTLEGAPVTLTILRTTEGRGYGGREEAKAAAPASASSEEGWEGMKNEGNANFKLKRFEEAMACYSAALEDDGPLALERATLLSAPRRQKRGGFDVSSRFESSWTITDVERHHMTDVRPSRRDDPLNVSLEGSSTREAPGEARARPTHPSPVQATGRRRRSSSSASTRRARTAGRPSSVWGAASASRHLPRRKRFATRYAIDARSDASRSGKSPRRRSTTRPSRRRPSGRTSRSARWS